MDYAVKDFGKILKKNHMENRSLLGQATDCMRVYDRNQAQFPVTVDLYGKYARITDYSDNGLPGEDVEKCTHACASNLYLEPGNIVFTARKKRTGIAQHEKSNANPVVTHVSEDGLDFEVNLTTYTDTGLFLDQAVARRFVREQSAGKHVLNLFSYTGSFSVYAAAGGADSVTSVDLSATYTAWAQRNLESNGFAGDGYRCLCCDAWAFIEQAVADGLHYGIIVFDPPAFSNSRKTEHDFDVQKDWYRWMVELEKLLEKDGFILFSTSLSGFEMDGRGLGLRRAEVTDLFRAPGFKKGMKGSVRSWIMAKEESTLSLDWSDDRKKKYPEKRGKSGYYRKDNERRPAGNDRRRYDRYDNRRFDDREPRRGFSDDRPVYGRNEYRPRRDYDRGYNDGSRFEDRFERRGPSYRGGSFRASREREYQGDRNRDRRERRDYQDRRPARYDGRNGMRENREGYEKNERQRSPRREKPYGYDSFRPARGRGENSKFFWNDDDKN